MLEAIKLINQLVGKPCWGVRHSYGSFLTAEFGTPHLNVREGDTSAKHESLRKRRVRVRGDWHLWIYCCNWIYDVRGNEIANSESCNSDIDNAVRRIDSQVLNEIRVSCASGATSFHFEDGSILQTTPYASGDALWLIYAPSGEVLSVKGGGFVSCGPGTISSSEERWVHLPSDLVAKAT